MNISRVCGCGPHWSFDPLCAANFELRLTAATPGAENPDVDILYPGSTSPCGHVPCVILLKGSKSQPHVQWLMCLTLHEMSLYSEATTSSFYLGHFAYCLPVHSWLTDWLAQMQVLMRGTWLLLHFETVKSLEIERMLHTDGKGENLLNLWLSVIHYSSLAKLLGLKKVFLFEVTCWYWVLKVYLRTHLLN